MHTSAVRFVAISSVLASVLSGCGTRTPLGVGGDGSVGPMLDGGRPDARPFDAGRPDASRCRVAADCDDRQMCNGVEQCAGGSCISGSPPFCEDMVSCTVEECIEGRGCVSTPNDGLCPPGMTCGPGGCTGRPCRTDGECDDRMACNGLERCGPDGLCVGGDPPRCDDGVDCTIDICSEPGGMCSRLADNTRCPIGTCDVVRGCIGVMCGTPFDCDDGRLCNGTETCTGGSCANGPPPACSDGIACTDDFCSDAIGGCTSTPNSARCPMGSICTPGAGTADGCTRRPCSSDFDCNDGIDCNGAERCAPGTGTCVAGPAPSCNDFETCTIDRCIEGFGCVNEPRATRDICGNGIDDDCDSQVDCADFDCRGVPDCPSCVPMADFEFDCFDGQDQDCDDRIDCEDPDCVMSCMVFEICDNFFDDDGDGRIDCQDSDCAFEPRCRDSGGPRDGGPPRDSGPPIDSGPIVRELGIPLCTNGRDDDGDGRVDCRDSDCSPFGPMGECCNDMDDDGDGSTDLFTCRCFDNSTCAGVGDVEQTCWTESFNICAPRCNFIGGDAWCAEILPDLPRCNRTTGECVR